MASTGIAKRWNGPFGLVEMEDGNIIRIDTDQIDGGKLRVGYPVSFDIEMVKNQKKGINVTGEAVLAKDTVLTPEQLEADKKKIEEMRAKQDAVFNALWEDVQKLSQQAKTQLLRQLQNKLGDTWEMVNEKDKRYDGKKAFTRGEFLAFYGAKVGAAKWTQAKRKPPGGNKTRKGKKDDTEEKKDEGAEAEAAEAEAADAEATEQDDATEKDEE